MSETTRCDGCGQVFPSALLEAWFGGLCPDCLVHFAFAETDAMSTPSSTTSDVPSSPEEATFLTPGTIFRDIEIVERLGRGGMGVVYRGRQLHLDREVAVKTIAGPFAGEADFQRRFAREAKLLASLRHPEVVTIHDFGLEEGQPFFVMEFVEGGSLRRHAADPTETLEHLLAVARALRFAHERGVIHRDIKPENILLDEEGRVKVADFGIARIAAGPDATQVSADVAGTPGYMAPELIEDPERADHRVDLYALGVMGLELLTGRIPSASDPAPVEIAGIDERAVEILRLCADRDPDRRPATAGAVVEALEAVVGPSPATTTGGPPPLDLRVRLDRLRRSRLFWAIAAGLFFEALLLAGQVRESFAIGPAHRIDRLVASVSSAETRDEFVGLRDHPDQEAVDEALIEASESSDGHRRQVAVQAAVTLGRWSRLSARARALALLEWNEDYQLKVGLIDSIDHDGQVAGYALAAIEEAGPAMGPELFRGLVEGKYEEPFRHAAINGLARVASPELVRTMQRHLLEQPDHPASVEILLAFGSRIDLPVVEWTWASGEAMPEALREIYWRHLPDILDEETAEARWEVASRLDREVHGWGFGRSRDGVIPPEVSCWLAYHWADREGYDTQGSPPERLAAAFDEVSWPLDEHTAEILEARLRMGGESPHPYRAALLLRWHRTGRYTLPYFPHPPVELGRWATAKVLHRNVGVDEARAILDADRLVEAGSWEVASILFPRAGHPTAAVSARGRGPVRARLSGHLRSTETRTEIHVGMQPVVRTKKADDGGVLDTKLEGTLLDGGSEGYFFEGHLSETFRAFGTALSSQKDVTERVRSGEAAVVGFTLEGASGGGIYPRHFTLLLADPSDGLDPDARWRTAVARTLDRLARQGSPDPVRPSFRPEEMIFVPSSFGHVLAVAAWFPVPEAREALLTLWNDPRVASGRFQIGADDVPAHRYVGAALLQLGETAPLGETDWIEDLPEELALRFHLHGSTRVIREAFEDRAAGFEAGSDSPEILEALRRQGISHSRVATGPEEWVAVYRSARFESLIPSAMVALLALAIGWIGGWSGTRNRRMASALIYTGFVLRFFTIDVGGRLWFPVGGDLLFLVAAFLYGGWVLRGVSLALVASGFLQLMVPESASVLFASGSLFVAYGAILGLDLLTRRLGGRLGGFETVCHLVLWWAFVVPGVFLFGLSFLLSLGLEEFSFRILSLSKDTIPFLLAAMIGGPLGAIRSPFLRGR